MNVIVLTGPESSGKSHLARYLHYTQGGVLCGEYVREFIDEHQRETTLADIPAIAHGQLALEDQARAQRPDWLWLDTHLLNNIIWSQVLFDSSPPWLEEALRARHYDLHLLLSPEGVPWMYDPQRCQPQLSDRRAFFETCRAWLKANGQAYVVLEGDWAARQAQATVALDRHFKNAQG
jgi:nicotinamide riboside kinase